jgi:DNA helicase-2/ATP-dependent DNA helicase PcrA
MSIEYRVFGPPGTGKTTRLSRDIANAVEKHGADAVMVASFTRAAAQELVSRDLPVLRDRIGTLHSLCYRALGSPELVETKKYLEEWNKEHPAYALSITDKDVDESTGEIVSGTDGDETFQEYQRCRALRMKPELWPSRVQVFHKAWKAFKDDTNTIDFTDMIELALLRVPTAPGAPQIGFFDEAQDFSQLELDLVRQWSKQMEFIVMAGDDDQSIYFFKGARAEAFLDPPIPEAQIRILQQSYRVPRMVQHLATRWISGVGRRQEKEYAARDHEGEIRYSDAHYKYPELLLPEIEDCLNQGKSVMILASCSYMLGPTVQLLRKEGLAFHNPFRTKRGDWNPLARRGDKRISPCDRLLSYLSSKGRGGYFAGADLHNWVEICNTKGLLKRGAKKAIDLFADVTDLLSDNDILSWFEPDALIPVFEGDLDFLEEHLLAARRNAMTLPLAIARKRGVQALEEKPRIIVGTIHSVKGGEADVVILFPDLSGSGIDSWHRGGEEQDSVRRMFYVALTRARDELVLCSPASSMAVNIT